MTIAILVCFLFAILALSVWTCFAKNKSLPFSMLLFVSSCMGFVFMLQKGNFETYSILIVLSITQLFITTSDNTNRLISVFQALSFALVGIYLTFCGLYIGRETYWGVLIGIALAFALTFLFLIVHKVKKFDLLQTTNLLLTNLGAGLLLGTILPVLLYSTSILNILFVTGTMLYSIYIIFQSYLKTNYNHLILTAAIIILLFTIYV